MGLLSALGINYLAIVQFGIFILIFIFLTTYVFNPFLKAAEERQKRTKGGEELAEEFHHKAIALQAQYEQEARALNAGIQDVFQKNRAEAAAESERVVGQARKEANETIEKNRQAIVRAVETASGELKSQTPAMALAITNKLLGK